MAQLSLKEVSKVFEGGAVAAEDVSFAVEDREFVVLVGPSGCGKSTILRLIAGLEEPTAGEIFIDGQLVNDRPPKDRDIAMVFQNYALYPHMTVRENLAFGLKMQRTPRAEVVRSVGEAAELLGLEPFLERKPRALSGGQRQRVALGRALVRKPKVFLFDEPLSNLDAKLRVQMRAELIKLHAELDATIVFVTHDQVEAMTMGSRIVVLNEGKVQQIAAPLELYHRPLNRFVAGFIGSPSMNLVEGTLRPTADGMAFMEAGGAWNFRLPSAVSESRVDQEARRVHLGFRPEDGRFVPPGNAEEQSEGIEARVEVLEPLGYDTFVSCSADPYHMVIRAEGGVALSIGDRVGVEVDPAKVHLFDLESGRRL
jgi:multiple sugar transport system ATP-binding protein